MTVRELVAIMWYAQKIKIVKEVFVECRSNEYKLVGNETLFSGQNYRLRSEQNKKFLNYEVQCFGCFNDEIVITVK